MEWHYSKAGAQHGPISEAEIKQLIANGTLQATDLAWNSGMTEWLPISQVPALGAGGGQLAQGSPYQTPSAHAGNAAATANIPTYLWQSICVTLLCCLIGGIVAIVYASKVDGLKQAGDIAGATEASNKAKTWCLWSLIIGLVVQGALIVINVMAAGAAASSGSY